MCGRGPVHIGSCSQESRRKNRVWLTNIAETHLKGMAQEGELMNMCKRSVVHVRVQEAAALGGAKRIGKNLGRRDKAQPSSLSWAGRRSKLTPDHPRPDLLTRFPSAV